MLVFIQPVRRRGLRKRQSISEERYQQQLVIQMATFEGQQELESYIKLQTGKRIVATFNSCPSFPYNNVDIGWVTQLGG